MSFVLFFMVIFCFVLFMGIVYCFFIVVRGRGMKGCFGFCIEFIWVELVRMLVFYIGIKC